MPTDDWKEAFFRALHGAAMADGQSVNEVIRKAVSIADAAEAEIKRRQPEPKPTLNQVPKV